MNSPNQINPYKTIIQDGLWNNNPATVQILGMCPLLAVSTSMVNGLGLGLATTLVLTSSCIMASLVRHWVRPEIRIPIFVLVIASLTTVVELLIKGMFYDLYLVLGIFIPLIVTNCVVIGRVEAFASKNSVVKSALDGFMMGVGFTLALIILGGMRELVGQGTLFSQAHVMLGEFARSWEVVVIPNYRGFLLAMLPPGAFIGLGFIIAIKNVIDQRMQRTQSVSLASLTAESAH